MLAQTIRLWLIEKPRPYSLRLTDSNGETSLVNVGSQTFIRLAGTVCAMNPTLIEALDERGSVIRATRGEEGDELSADATLPRTAPNAAPAALVDVTTMQLVAKLLADAHKHATETAFERLANLFEMVTKRTESLERALQTSERMRLQQAESVLAAREEALEVKEESEGELGGIMKEVAKFAGAAGASLTNGKGH